MRIKWIGCTKRSFNMIEEIILKCCFHRGSLMQLKCQNEMGANWNINFRWTFSKSLEIEWEIVDFYRNSICLYISHVLLSIRLYTQWVKCTSLARLLSRLVMTLWNKCLSLVFTCFHSMNSVWHSTWYRNEIEIVSSFKLNQYGEEISYYCVEYWNFREEILNYQEET